MSEPVQPICQVCLEPIEDSIPGICKKCFEEAVDRLFGAINQGEEDDEIPQRRK